MDGLVYICFIISFLDKLESFEAFLVALCAALHRQNSEVHKLKKWPNCGVLDN
jgi:hypothetical protein